MPNPRVADEGGTPPRAPTVASLFLEHDPQHEGGILRNAPTRAAVSFEQRRAYEQGTPPLAPTSASMTFEQRRQCEPGILRNAPTRTAVSFDDDRQHAEGTRPRAPTGVVRALRGLFLLVLLGSAVLVMGAKCSPSGARVIVFMQGYYSTYDREGTEATIVEGQRFNVLKNAFAAKGYARASLLDFSYSGGGVAQDGTWRPSPYTCAVTDRVSGDNLALLETMLRDYGAHHQNAHFTLVGHSLGGYLAFLEGAREAGRTKAAKLGIEAVVTLDAPLKGASADKKLVLDIVPCEKTYLAGAEIVEQGLDSATPGLRRDQVQMMADQGIRVATYGNSVDCFWNPAVCVPALPWVDDSGTQVLDNAAASHMYRVESVPLASHDAILGDAVVGADVVGFVGAP